MNRYYIIDRAKAFGASDEEAVWLADSVWIDTSKIGGDINLSHDSIDRILKAALWWRGHRMVPLDSLPHPRVD